MVKENKDLKRKEEDKDFRESQAFKKEDVEYWAHVRKNRKLKIESAQYMTAYGIISCIMIVVNGEPIFVPLDPRNRYYVEVMCQVYEGTLVIKDPD